MTFVVAIIPVFLIILSGYCCKYYQFPDDNFWRGAEKITYFLLFPALLVSKMATADLADIDFLKPLSVVVLLYSLITLLLVAIKSYISSANAEFTSIYQGGIRLIPI